jgi:chemotaxis family two-component system response regulator Rcp1
MSARPKRILVVDDSSADVRLLREALREHRVTVELIAEPDGESALAHLREAARLPDLVLLDLNLPGIDGREVLERLKADPSLASIPVIVLSTSSSPTDVADCYARHANAYLVKPLHLDEFTDLVRGLESFWLRLVRLPSLQVAR